MSEILLITTEQLTHYPTFRKLAISAPVPPERLLVMEEVPARERLQAFMHYTPLSHITPLFKRLSRFIVKRFLKDDSSDPLVLSWATDWENGSVWALRTIPTLIAYVKGQQSKQYVLLALNSSYASDYMEYIASLLIGYNVGKMDHKNPLYETLMSRALLVLHSAYVNIGGPIEWK